jgi:AraC-like DNA-binding protein
MGEVAAAMCMSERTLRRRLQKEGTTFAALCDEIRRSTAEQLLTCSHLPVEHIAGRLGYAEPASFIHAFKRWKGRTPGAFRSALPVGGHAVTPPRAASASWTSEPGDSMSQQQFEAFMAAQIAAIEASGVDPEVWVERHSTTFRAAWENRHAA